MILLIGSYNDPTLEHFIKFLWEENNPFILLEQSQITKQINFNLTTVKINSKVYAWHDFNGVYVRMSSPNPKDKNFHQLSNSLLLLEYILASVCNNVINLPYAMMSNESKLYQLANSKLDSIKIPWSIVLANTPAPIFNEPVVYKSLSGFRSIVKQLSDDKQNQQITSPVLFQQLLDGKNIRVHVVKDDVFSLEVTTDSLDYRYPEVKTTFSPVMLPSKIQRDCVQITKKFDLSMSGIDLIRVGDRYYLLEVNPSPGYSGFERFFHKPVISKKLYEVLNEY